MSELSPEARALLDKALGAEDLSAAGRGRIRRALATQLGAGPAVAPRAIGPTGSAGKTAGGGTFAFAPTAKVLAAFAIVSAVGAGGFAVAVHATSYFDPSRRVPLAMRGAPSVAAQVTPADAPITKGRPSVAPGALLPAAGVLTSPRAATSRRSSAISVSASAGSFERETRLLRDASLELSADRPDLAIALLDEHARSFSRGALVEERRVERILTLCALGRTAEAQAEGARFLTEQPGSLLAHRVRSSCAHAPEESEQQAIKTTTRAISSER
jgi:hypothetical protein